MSLLKTNYKDAVWSGDRRVRITPDGGTAYEGTIRDITSYDEALNFCRSNKKALIEYALNTIGEGKRFKKYGITTDWLKVDNIIFTSQKVLDIMFVLK